MPDEVQTESAVKQEEGSRAAAPDVVSSERKSKIGAIVKFLLIIAILFGVVYLFLNPESIQGFADNYLGGLLS